MLVELMTLALPAPGSTAAESPLVPSKKIGPNGDEDCDAVGLTDLVAVDDRVWLGDWVPEAL
jgi:hypothetical protein